MVHSIKCSLRTRKSQIISANSFVEMKLQKNSASRCFAYYAYFPANKRNASQIEYCFRTSKSNV